MPVVYHSRRPAADVTYKHYPNLVDMARDVDLMIVITPGGAATKNLINAEVLKALGPNGILINVARGSVVDEQALIQALKDKTILSAGLDVFACGAAGVGRTDGDGQCRAAAARRLGLAARRASAMDDAGRRTTSSRGLPARAPLTPVAETPVRK